MELGYLKVVFVFLGYFFFFKRFGAANLSYKKRNEQILIVHIVNKNCLNLFSKYFAGSHSA